MRHHAHRIITHPLISGSGIIFVGSFGASILAYLFNLFMGRLLPVSDYGLLTALTSLAVLFSVFQQSFVGIFAKFAAQYNARRDETGFAQLLSSGFRSVTIFSLILLVVLVVSLPLFARIMKVEDLRLLIMIFLSIIISIVYAFPLGVLQGEMHLKVISFLNLLSPLIKIVFGIGLVIAGYSVFGVMVGVLAAALIPLFIALAVIRNRHQKKSVAIESGSAIFFQEFKSYSVYFFASTLGIMVISNADIILVRYFFDTVISGQYAALSLMGKAIFYLTSPIYFVFFPLIAQKNEKNEEVLKTLLLTIVLITGISIAMSFGYFLFPQLVLSVFFPAPEYGMLTPYLGPFSLFIVMFSLANLFNNYFLSIGKTEVYKINLLVAALFILAISFFHESLFQVIGVLFSASLLMLILYLLYYYLSYNGKN